MLSYWFKVFFTSCNSTEGPQRFVSLIQQSIFHSQSVYSVHALSLSLFQSNVCARTHTHTHSRKALQTTLPPLVSKLCQQRQWGGTSCIFWSWKEKSLIKTQRNICQINPWSLTETLTWRACCQSLSSLFVCLVNLARRYTDSTSMCFFTSHFAAALWLLCLQNVMLKYSWCYLLSHWVVC